MSILLISGSPAVPSSSSRLLHHIGDKLAAHGHRTTRLDVRDLPAQALLAADPTDAVVRAALAEVADADAVIVATPVYKAAYAGVLKAFLDLLPQNGLAGKIVLPVATGGSQSHLLALDYALRPVLHALEADQVLTSIYATSQQVQWSEQEGVLLAPEIAVRVAAGVATLDRALGYRSAAEQLANAAARSLQDHPYVSQAA
ncbi:NADPH-dependent FMN reductase [Pseudoduganella albidiflava]|uniref:FMN reductase (NADPH) n=1 Tax=Pseudoduganella albidiflava TaxID=321983 RepID=A0A411WWG5_9BURK|nr:NADPH-dependent FMN reductase [Pseudoduganella albidiflava]QBI01009.1 FMN reductase (NADPH) [Pseudoduganella albidiflava]GGY47404.1 NAD(P)H-dependent FMN reductase [Pseudoduganella albidiflava]